MKARLTRDHSAELQLDRYGWDLRHVYRTSPVTAAPSMRKEDCSAFRRGARWLARVRHLAHNISATKRIHVQPHRMRFLSDKRDTSDWRRTLLSIIEQHG